jgi:hypothetical protein
MYLCQKPVKVLQQQQQQQQHSLLSQASWGRLEMKPKRDEKPVKVLLEKNDSFEQI